MPRVSRGASIHYKPIDNYGIIGDLETAALVGMDGAIDFMCFPQFDSPTIFAALLDYLKGGSFKLAPLMREAKQKQLYIPDSNILLTRFLCDFGMAEVSDFMAITELGHAHDLVRRAKCIRGETPFRMVCDPRFDYGRAGHKIEKKANEVLFLSNGPDKTVLRLRSEVPLRIQEGAAVAEFTLRSGWTKPEASALSRPTLCNGGFQGDAELLASMGAALTLSRRMARNGQPRGFDPEAADLGTIRLHSCCADLWTA
jgi:hypothetical protein